MIVTPCGTMPGPGEGFTGAGMHGEHDRRFLGLVRQPVHDGAQLLGIVGVLGAVDGGQRVAAGCELQILQNRGAFAGPGGGEYGRVIHDVAGVMDACCNALALEIYDRLHRRTEQQGAEMVGDHAVDLLRHAPVERPQASLHMRHRNVELGRGERAGQASSWCRHRP